jgi:hypothetical protein
MLRYNIPSQRPAPLPGSGPAAIRQGVITDAAGMPPILAPCGLDDGPNWAHASNGAYPAKVAIKRHLVVDSEGIPLGMTIKRARVGVVRERLPAHWPTPQMIGTPPVTATRAPDM